MDQSTIGSRRSAVAAGTKLQRTTTAVPSPRPRARIEKFRAPFALRCGALLIDYILLASMIAISTLIARSLGGGARIAGSSTETIGLVITAVAAVLNFGVFAGLTGQTVGKWATGLRIQRTDGRRIGLGRAAVRHFIGYPLSFATLGVGFLLAAIGSRGRALHDLLTDTTVVREEIVAQRERR